MSHANLWAVIIVTVCLMVLYLFKSGIDDIREHRQTKRKLSERAIDGWYGGSVGPQGPQGPQGPPGECLCAPEMLTALSETTKVIVLAGRTIERLTAPSLFEESIPERT